jgi:L-ascorbate metabolism protein UlaG (beta-lactamase superfamily)
MHPRAPLLALALAASTPGCTASAVLRNDFAALGRRPAPAPRHADSPFRDDARLAVLWIGHASVLLQMDDKLILTDPVFTGTIGVFLRRLVEPGLTPEALPRADAVLISHVHADHLSIGSLAMIERKVGFLVVPQKGTACLPDFAFEVVELPTWSTFERGGLRVTAVPVKHTGFRWGIDQPWMDTSFTGYVIEYHGMTVYFGGDSAYVPELFRATRARFPSIDLAILPIAPIHPRPFLEAVHMDPREAILAFRDLGARWMVPIHFGTLPNDIDAPGEPLRLLGEERAAQGVPAERVRVLEIGEQQVLVPRPADRTP